MYSMPSVTIGVGVLLSAYGAYSAFIVAEKFSVTALIPTFFGIAFVALGFVAQKEHLRKHAMHVAAALGLLGFLGGAAMGFKHLPALFSGQLEREAETSVEKKKELNKARSQNLLAFVCLVFVILCINSFVQARRRRQEGQGAASAQLPK